MTDRTLGRLGGATGALSVILVMVGNSGVLSGGSGGSAQPPDLTSNRAQVAQWVATLRAPDALDWAGMVIEGAGLLCMLLFTAYLYSRLRSAEAGRSWLAPAALAGGVLSVAIKMSSIPPMLALFFRAHDGMDTQLAMSLIDQNSFAFIETWAANGILLAAAGLAGIRYGALPGSLAWSGLVIGILLLVSTPFALGPVYPVTLLFLLWMAVSGVTFMVRPVAVRKESPAGVPPQPAASRS